MFNSLIGNLNMQNIGRDNYRKRNLNNTKTGRKNDK